MTASWLSSPAALASCDGGEQAGLGLDRDVALEPVLTASARSCAHAGPRCPQWR